MTPQTIDLHSDEGTMLGHALLFWSAMGVAMYLILFEGMIFERLSGNRLAILILIACILQMMKCIVTNLSLNYAEYDTYAAYAINGTLGMLLFYSTHIAYAYVLFANSLETKRKLFNAYIIFHTVILVTFTIGIYATEKEIGANIGGLYVISTWFILQFVIIRFYIKHKRRDFKIPKSMISYEGMNKALIVAELFTLIGGGLGVVAGISDTNKWLRAGGGYWYPASLIIAVFAGQADFMQPEKEMDVTEVSATESERASLQI